MQTCSRSLPDIALSRGPAQPATELATEPFPVKVVADTLGVARSNLVEQMSGASRRRGRYQRQGDDEVLAAIRQLTDAVPHTATGELQRS